jgi:hypothetical protein
VDLLCNRFIAIDQEFDTGVGGWISERGSIRVFLLPGACESVFMKPAASFCEQGFWSKDVERSTRLLDGCGETSPGDNEPLFSTDIFRVSADER